MSTKHKDMQDKLNRCMPIADDVKLGDLLQELVDKHNSMLAKLDADAGVTDTDYVSTLSMSNINDR